jgi:Tfp pilus assembly protein PilN
MRAVNLLVEERSKKRAPSKTVLAGAASSGAVLMLLGAGYVNAHSSVQRREVALKELQAQLAAIPPVKTQVQSTEDAKLATEKAGRLSVLSSALSTRVRWDRLLSEIAIVLPGDVWLNTLDATAPTVATSDPAIAAAPGAPTASATTFNIVGHTYNHEGVARLLIRLQLVPDLENVQLISTQSSGSGASTVVQFTIEASVKAPGSSS